MCFQLENEYLGWDFHNNGLVNIQEDMWKTLDFSPLLYSFTGTSLDLTTGSSHVLYVLLHPMIHIFLMMWPNEVAIQVSLFTYRDTNYFGFNSKLDSANCVVLNFKRNIFDIQHFNSIYINTIVFPNQQSFKI